MYEISENSTLVSYFIISLWQPFRLKGLSTEVLIYHFEIAAIALITNRLYSNFQVKKCNLFNASCKIYNIFFNFAFKSHEMATLSI